MPKPLNSNQKLVILKTYGLVIPPWMEDIVEESPTKLVIYKFWKGENEGVIIRVTVEEDSEGENISRDVAFDDWSNRLTTTYY